MDTKEVKDVIAGSKKLKVLYVEDSDDLREQTVDLLGVFFDHIDIAIDGLEGLNKYKDFYKENSSYYDIIISDINMPKMDGVSMSKEILKLNKKQSIFIVSAHNESDKLTELLDIQITKYLHKPIDYEVFIEALSHIVENVLEEKKEKKNIAIVKKLNFVLKNDLKDLAINFVEAISFPVFVVNGDDIVYINKPFEELLNQKKLLHDGVSSMEVGESIFEEKDGYFQSLNDLEVGKDFEKKYYYKNEDDIKIFVIEKKMIKLPTYHKDTFLIMLDDVYPLLSKISMVEYQKNKIKTYNEVLENILAKKSFESGESIVKAEDLAAIKSIQSDINNADISISKNVISSKEYLASLDPVILLDIAELEGIAEDLALSIDLYAKNPTKNSIEKTAKLLTSYAIIVDHLVKFEVLANAIKSLSNFLLELDDDILINKKDDIIINLDSFIDDLIHWRENIFLKENTIDIHYLDSSLLSSSLQLQLMIVTNANKDEDKGDLELYM